MVKIMSDSEQKGFVVYGDYKAIVDELDDEQAGKLFRGMLNYFVSGEEPKFQDVLKFVFIPIKQQMDRDGNKYAKRCERNRQNAQMRWDANGCDRMRTDANGCDRIKKMRTDAIAANTNTNININTNKDTNTKPPESGNQFFPALLSFLNSETGGTYEETEQFDDMVRDLLNKGYTEQDIRTVIHKKSIEWSCDGKMRSCLRPSVLLGDKFEEYLNAPEPIEAEEEKQHRESADELERDLEQKTGEFDSLNEEIRRIRESDNDNVNYDEFNAMKLRAAILEQEIDSIHRRLGAT